MKISLEINCKFIELCKYGDLDIIKEFYYNNHKEININIYNDYVFQNVCYKGQAPLEVAQWLISIPNNKINISAENDFAFLATQACSNVHL